MKHSSGSASGEGLRERKKRAARDAIQREALRLFVEDGYESVSVEQIAAAANVSRATFFNYFPSKDAVLTEPDREVLDTLRDLCAQRPEDEPLWQALTAVIIGVVEARQDAIATQLRLKATSPAIAATIHRANEQTLAHLRDWAESRSGSAERDRGLLQLNVATAATNTAFDAWQPDDGIDDLLAAIRSNLERVGRAFT